MVAACLLLAALIVNLTEGTAPLKTIGPQILLALAVHPAVIWLVAQLDRLRLIPIRELDR